MRVIPKFVPVLFVWVEALRLSQQFFSHVGTEPPLPGYYQYFWGGKCILLKDTTRRPEWGSNPRPLAPISEALPLGHGASLIYTCVVDQVDIVQNGWRPRMLYTAFNRRYMWFDSRPRPTNQPSAAITTDAGETITIVHLRYCVGSAKLVFSDEVNEVYFLNNRHTFSHGTISGKMHIIT